SGATSWRPLYCGITDRERFLTTESEFLERKRDDLWIDSNNAHAAQCGADLDAVLLLCPQITQNCNRVLTEGIECDGGQTEVRQRRPDLTALDQRDERIAPAVGIVLKDFSIERDGRCAVVRCTVLIGGGGDNRIGLRMCVTPDQKQQCERHHERRGYRERMIYNAATLARRHFVSLLSTSGVVRAT